MNVLAKVGDRIEHGETIPANVVRMTDGSALSTPGGVARVIETGLSRYWTGGRMETWDDGDIPRHLYPLSVVEVDADPAPSGLCEVGPDRIRCAITDSDHRRIYHLGRPYEPQPGEVLPPVRSKELTVQYLDEPAESGPLVLTLPQVPPGAALYANGTRFELDTFGEWATQDGSWTGTLAGIFAEFADDGGVVVEMAPPREPRTWPKLDPAPEIDNPPLHVDVVTAEGIERCMLWSGRYVRRDHQGYWTLTELRELGEVREVIES